MLRAFPEKPYRQRAKIETIFSAIKRKLSSRAPGRSLSIQIRQALLLGLAYNLYRLRHPLIWEDVNRAINTYQKTGGGGPPGKPPSASSPFATQTTPVICATWRLYPLWLQSIAHTSCHHAGVLPPTPSDYKSPFGDSLFPRTRNPRHGFGVS